MEYVLVYIFKKKLYDYNIFTIFLQQILSNKLLLIIVQAKKSEFDKDGI